MSEKLCLQWNNFQEYAKTSFMNLREDKYFTDVTLACEDGQQGGTQGDLGGDKSVLPETVGEAQTSSTSGLHERGED